MRRSMMKISALMAASAFPAQVFLAPLALAQSPTYTKTFTITGTEGGPFRIKATVSSIPGVALNSVPLQARDPFRTGMPGGLSPLQFGLPYTKAEVDGIEEQIAQRLAAERSLLIARLLGQALEPGAAVKLMDLSALPPKKALLVQLFLQYQRDQIIKNFERRLLTDRYLAGQLGAYGRRDLLWAVRDMLMGAASIAARKRSADATAAAAAAGAAAGAGAGAATETAAGAGAATETAAGAGAATETAAAAGAGVGAATAAAAGAVAGRTMLSAEEIALKLKELMGDKLSEDAAKKVMEALQDSTAQSTSSGMREDVDHFASLEDRLDLVAAAAPVKSGARSVGGAGEQAEPEINPDDYEAWLKLSDEVGKDDLETKKQFLEMAMEAAGRLGSSQSTAEPEKQKAREFALRLTTRFHDLKTAATASSKTEKMAGEIDFNIEKCIRINSGKDFYA